MSAAIPESTKYYWLGEEAYVLRSLRDLGLTKHKTRAAAAVIDPRFGWGAPVVESILAQDVSDAAWLAYGLERSTWP